MPTLEIGHLNLSSVIARPIPPVHLETEIGKHILKVFPTDAPLLLNVEEVDHRLATISFVTDGVGAKPNGTFVWEGCRQAHEQMLFRFHIPTLPQFYNKSIPYFYGMIFFTKGLTHAPGPDSVYP